MMRFFVYAIFAALILGQLARLQLSESSSAALVLIDVVNAAYVGFGLIFALAARKRFPLTLSTIFLIAFLGWMLISLLVGSRLLDTSQTLVAFSYALRLLLMFGTGVVTAMLFPREEEQSHLVKGFFVTGLILTLLGFAQLIIFPNFAFMAKFGWDPHQGRLLSTFFDPNFFGMFLVFLFSLSLAYLLVKPKQPIVTSLILAILGMAIVATLSRSAYLALLIAGFIIVLFRSWRLLVVAAIALIMVAISVPRVRERVVGAAHIDTTAQARLKSWSDTYKIIRDNAAIGVGYNAFGYAEIRYGLQEDLESHASRGSDSSFLLVLATTGIIGASLFALFWLSLLYEAFLAYRFATTPFGQIIGLALLGLIPAYIIHSQFVNSLFYPLLLIPFMFLVAPLLSLLANSRLK